MEVLTIDSRNKNKPDEQIFFLRQVAFLPGGFVPIG